MKRNILSAVFAIAIAFSVSAQRGHKGHQKIKFTPEQKVTLSIKKMTLALDLSSSQQQKLKPILLEAASKRMKMMEARKGKKGKGKRNKISSDEAFAKMNNMLDQRIAFQNKIKNVLKEDQFEKWQKMKARMHHKRGDKMRGHHKGKKGKGKKQGKKNRVEADA